MPLTHTCLAVFFGLCLSIGAAAPVEVDPVRAADAEAAQTTAAAATSQQDTAKREDERQDDDEPESGEDEGEANGNSDAQDDGQDDDQQDAADQDDADDADAADDQAGEGRPDPPADVEPGVVELLDRIEARMKQIETVRTRFRWDSVQVMVGDEQQYFGTLSYVAKTPARFHAHVDVSFIDERRGEEDRQLIFDGSWMVDRNAKEKLFVKRQVVRPDAPEHERDPLGLGKGPFPVPMDAERDRILERFKVTLRPPMEGLEDENLIPAIRQRLERSVRLRLEPREGVRMDASEIDLWYDRETLLPQRIETADDRGNLTVFHLFIDPEEHLNVEIDDALFDVEPPRERGWEVQVEPIENGNGRRD